MNTKIFDRVLANQIQPNTERILHDDPVGLIPVKEDQFFNIFEVIHVVVIHVVHRMKEKVTWTSQYKQKENVTKSTNIHDPAKHNTLNKLGTG